jgi:hypothetical protein
LGVGEGEREREREREIARNPPVDYVLEYLAYHLSVQEDGVVVQNVEQRAVRHELHHCMCVRARVHVSVNVTHQRMPMCVCL